MSQDATNTGAANKAGPVPGRWNAGLPDSLFNKGAAGRRGLTGGLDWALRKSFGRNLEVSVSGFQDSSGQRVEPRAGRGRKQRGERGPGGGDQE